MGMIAIVGRVVRNERIFGLWKGVTPVSRFLLYLDRVLTFEKNKLSLIYVKYNICWICYLNTRLTFIFSL